MGNRPDIDRESSEDEEAERASRELGEQIENARRVLREYQSGIRRPSAGEESR